MLPRSIMATLGGPLQDNPYVGPRSIAQGEPIYGRDEEVQALFCELQARRIVVLHSPSGAGKSSLVQAGLIPRLEAGGFAVWRPIRVNLDLTIAEEVPEGTNRYLLSALSSLEEELPRERQRSLSELAQVDLATYLRTRPRRKKQVGRPVVLLLDQFEEVLTVAPQAVEAKRAFFEELGRALEGENLWALFIIREDFLAAFAPYRDRVPTHMTNTFRLDLLGIEGAREATLRPAESAGREFPAVDQLVRDLSMTTVQQADGSVVAQPGSYVEPVQLQVVCRRLWASMPEDAASIEHDHIVEYASVSESLAAYYAHAVAEAAGGDVAIERTIREWVGEMLIVGGIRSQVRLAAGGAGREKDETTAALDRARIQGLLDSYLVRVEPRAEVHWFELSHDRLVEPVLADNERWEREHLHPVQVQAKLWVNGRRASGLLLAEEGLAEALAWTEDNDAQLTENERDFLRRSQDLRARERREHRQRRNRYIVGSSVMGLVAVVSAGAASVVLGNHQDIREKKAKAEDLREQLEDKDIALRTKLAVQQSQQASMMAEAGGQLVAAIDLAVDAVSLLEAEAEGKQAIAAEVGQSEAPVELPFAVFKGLTDALGRIAGGLPLEGHTDRVVRLAVSPTTTAVATASKDGTVRVWDVRTGAAIWTLEGHKGAVHAVAYSPDGRWLASTGEDGTVRVWEVATRWALEDETLEHGAPVTDVAWSPDGATVATVTESTGWIWRMDTDAVVVPLIGHDGIILRVAFSPDGTVLATTSKDGTVRVWDANSGAALRILKGHEGPVGAVAFSPDSRRIVTGGYDQTVRTWDAATGEFLDMIDHGQIVEAVAVSPDGRYLATGTFDDDAGHLWEWATKRKLTSFRHEGVVADVAFTPAGDQVLTASWDKSAHLWSTRPSLPFTWLEGHTDRVDAVAVSLDGARIVTGSGDHTARVWDARTGALRNVLRGHRLDVLAVAVSPDGSRIVTGSWDETGRVWDAVTGLGLYSLEGHTKPVWTVTVSPDGTRLATGSDDQTARVWDAATGRVLQVIEHDKPVRGVVFTPEGDRVVTVVQDRPARVWIAATGEAVTDALAPGFPGNEPMTAVAYSPDGRWLAAGTRDGAVRRWDRSSVESDSGPQMLKGHTGAVVALVFSTDGGWLASGSEDGTARVWNNDSNDEPASTNAGAHTAVDAEEMAATSLWHDRPVTGVALLGDGGQLVTTNGDALGRVWSLDVQRWVRWGCKVLAERGAPTIATPKVPKICESRAVESQMAQWPALATTDVRETMDTCETMGACESASGDHERATVNGEAESEATEPPEVIAVHGVEMVLIPGGTFVMGSPPSERERDGDEGPQHDVTLESFYMARTEVTNAQYARYLEANLDALKPVGWASAIQDKLDQPVTGLNWTEAQAYCEWAGVQLPTEAQWEYAARGGTTMAYWFGDEPGDLGRFEWFEDNAGGRAHAVGTKGRNPWGLYDMHGNVSEWCWDAYGGYEIRAHAGDGSRHQPVGVALRVIRGGNFDFVSRRARSAVRGRNDPNYRVRDVGFRVVQVPLPP